MMPDFDKMTNAEINKYLSTHRSDEEVFSEGLKVLIERSQDNPSYSTNMSSQELEAVFKAKLKISDL